MAGDRFYSIHPRRGTNSILDKKTGTYFHAIASVKIVEKNKSHTKGGGILHTAHHNLLVGPDAVETWEKENFATDRESIERVFSKQRITMGDATKILYQASPGNWIMQHEPDVWAKTAKFVMLPTYLNFKLTGVLADTPANMQK